MLTYPTLSQAEQAALPTLRLPPVKMPAKFADSTHQLWLCATEQGLMALKVVDVASTDNGFWLGVNSLFSADFPQSLGDAKRLQHWLCDLGSIITPEVVSCTDNRFVLSHYLEGQDLTTETITQALVEQLATHISALHMQKSERWGAIHQPIFSAHDWSSRLHVAIATIEDKSNLKVPKTFLKDCIAQTAACQENDFVPIMLDLRWDQFKQQTDGKLALIDLDAFVVGPRSLALLILEYVLTTEQLTWFKAVYTQTHDWPTLGQQKQCYQLLLFLMHLLGETDLKKWLQKV